MLSVGGMGLSLAAVVGVVVVAWSEARCWV